MNTIGSMPLITLSGDATARGLQHGEGLRERIQQMVEVYSCFFGLSEERVFETATHFKKVISDFNNEYAIEIEAIAKAANLPPLWIYALNARSEFLSYTPATECTLLHFRGTPLLGQNWDWEERLEPLIALMRIEQKDKPNILMMSEPGIVGKIGLNSAGLGICFNFLPINRPTNGVPVHILLRALLECSTLAEARAMIERAGNGRSANIMVAHKNGERFDMEFAATEKFELTDKGDILAHTNHFIEQNVFTIPEMLENSTLRLSRVGKLSEAYGARDRRTMEKMLSDTENPGNSICQTYRTRAPLGEMGTVCSLTMDLEAGDMGIRLGNNAKNAFEHISLNAHQTEKVA
ncbi:MAG: C45 family peptidase [Parvibaculum sp.]